MQRFTPLLIALIGPLSLSAQLAPCPAQGAAQPKLKLNFENVDRKQQPRRREHPVFNPYLNLDFETATRGQPWSWITCCSGYELAFDTNFVVSGAQSLRIQDVNAPALGAAAATQFFPLADGKGHHITFSGFIRTDGITRGSARLGLLVFGCQANPWKEYITSNDQAPADGVSGTNDWQSFSIDRDISPDATSIEFSVALYGNGTAWFDNLSISIDGAPYPQGPPPNTAEPTSGQLNWVQQTANSFLTADPTVPPTDLWPVAALVGNAHIVGVGEATHGTREFLQMTHRLLEYLAANNGFTIIALETGMSEANRLNNYVLNGTGDPRQLLQGLANRSGTPRKCWI